MVIKIVNIEYVSKQQFNSPTQVTDATVYSQLCQNLF